MTCREVHIAAAVRTVVGKRGGLYRDVHPADLLATVQTRVLEAASVAPTDVDQVVGGCVTKIGEQAYNIARTAWLSVGLPEQVAGSTVDAHCGSSLQAVALGAALVASGSADVVLACGVESMSRHALGSDTHAGDGRPISATYRHHHEFVPQLQAAERLAAAHKLTRCDTDEFGLLSQTRAAAAWARGDLADEVVQVDGCGPLGRDEGIRETSLAQLAALPPVAGEGGLHTAGTSSQLSDGAAAVVLVSDDVARGGTCASLARVVAHCMVGVDPAIMLTGPIDATRKVLGRVGLGVDDVDLFEVNEAFASVVLAWSRQVGVDVDRVNPNGGAIAIGHPVGSSGARLTASMAHELRRRGGGRGVVTMCGAAGIAPAMLLEAAGR
jgi:acetyl-CoA C-acetyltransferase